MGHNFIYHEESRLIDGVLVTQSDMSLLHHLMCILYKFELISKSDILNETTTMGQWAARIWKAIENANSGICT